MMLSRIDGEKRKKGWRWAGGEYFSFYFIYFIRVGAWTMSKSIAPVFSYKADCQMTIYRQKLPRFSNRLYSNL